MSRLVDLPRVTVRVVRNFDPNNIGVGDRVSLSSKSAIILSAEWLLSYRAAVRVSRREYE